MFKYSMNLEAIEGDFKFIVVLLFWNHKNGMILVQAILGCCVASLTPMPRQAPQRRKGVCPPFPDSSCVTPSQPLIVSLRMSPTRFREYCSTGSCLERNSEVIRHSEKRTWHCLPVMRMSWWNHPHGNKFPAGCQERHPMSSNICLRSEQLCF